MARINKVTYEFYRAKLTLQYGKLKKKTKEFGHSRPLQNIEENLA